MAKLRGRSILWVSSLVLMVALGGVLYMWLAADAQNKELRKEVFQLQGQLESLEKDVKALNENIDRGQGVEQASESQSALERADQVIVAIKNKDGEAWARLIHPQKGVRFSPYSNVNQGQDVVLTQEQVRAVFSDPTSRTWGSYDGSGEPIIGDFKTYYQRFVYDVDYMTAPEVAINHVLGEGNIINNSRDVYPDATFVEYHFNGFDPQYGGMDWRSLSLVMEEKDGVWYLIGLIHGEWTI